MADRSIVETFAQALGQFETIGMPARNLASRTRREYARDLRDVVTCGKSVRGVNSRASSRSVRAASRSESSDRHIPCNNAGHDLLALGARHIIVA